ncbi:Tolloid-like protein 2 [Holothuria leucospilota]|uniref:Tolloid-like protein 2 n=1 Tax=Holothuria leucospilota TaxID=206669 RepID=A0A9Q0YDI1_HOLLE|nr:Tolloid-like protein 2 [Holothuria leucospilota]
MENVYLNTGDVMGTLIVLEEKTNSGVMGQVGIVPGEVKESIFVNTSYIFNSPNFPSNYPNDFEYTWYFSTNPGSQLLVTFNAISTESGYDYIYVREGSNISAISDLLLQWSGTGSPDELRILSSENIIWVTFISDGSVTYNGFEAIVEAKNMTREELNCGTEFDCENGVCLPQSRVCDGRRQCGNNADETNGNCIATLDKFWHRKILRNDSLCIQAFKHPLQNIAVVLKPCNELHFSSGTCGPSDFSCYDGDCVDWFLVCDGYPHCSGGEDEFWCNGTACNFFCNNMTCISSSVLCDGINDCDEGEDEGIHSCGGDIFLNGDNEVYIMSPNYPYGYPDNFNVSWKISTLGGYILEMQFLSFQTEHSYDFITIDEFDNITLTQLIKKWSGDDNSLQVSTSTHEMIVAFYSDSSVSAQGFQGIVTSVPGNARSSCPASYFDCGNGACFSMDAGCDEEVNCGNDADAELCSVFDIPEGTLWNITSPNYPSPYPASSNRTWYFRTDPGVQILVYFLSFSTEESYDFVTIGDGLQVSSHLLLEWSGYNPSVSILSTSNHLWFNFQSDESFNSDGFEAIAYAVNVPANGKEMLSSVLLSQT